MAATDMKHPLPDWRTDARYVAQAAKLDAVRQVLPDLDTRESQAMLAVSSAQDALDEIETLALANRAKPRDVELKRTALEAAQAKLAEATRRREQAERQQRLLEGGIGILADDARAEAATVLSDAALVAVERLERALAEAVAANKAVHDLQNFIRQQFPGTPGDASYVGALGMPAWPWPDLRPQIQGAGFKSETTYTRWQAAMAEWKRERVQLAKALPQRPVQKSA